MHKIFMAATTAAAIALGSTAANAVVVVTAPSPAVYTPPATGGFIGIVDPSAEATSSTTTNFSDTFAFSILGSPGLTNAQVGTILLEGVQNITFSSIMLDGNAFTLTSPAGAAQQWSCCGVNGTTGVLLGVGPHSIDLIGTLTGQYSASYSGTINIQTAAVPEPATWAMMLLGFGGMGLAVRRRRRTLATNIA